MSDLVLTDIQLHERVVLKQSLGKLEHALVTYVVVADVEERQNLVIYQHFFQILCTFCSN